MDHQTYVFKSDYALEDVEDTLDEILPKSMNCSWLSRERTRPLDADHLCTVMLQPVKDQKFSWPMMEGENALVIREVARIQEQ